MIEAFNGVRPRIGANVYIAPTAAVIGDVEILDGASVWYGAVIRGDSASIRIGRDSNIQDNCLIGINAVVLNGARICSGSIVAAGAVVLENQVIGPLELAAGIPAKVRRALPAEARDDIRHDAEIYLELSRRYREGTAG